MKYGKFRKLHSVNSSVIVPAFARAGLEEESLKIDTCGQFVEAVRCRDCGTNHFSGIYRCKSKFCAICNKYKSMLWVARLFVYIRDWLRCGKYVVFLNLTIRDRDSLPEGINLLGNSWRYMTAKSKSFSKEFRKRFVGGFKSLEVKTGKNSGKWHPHFHCLVLKDKLSYDKSFLNEAWPHAVTVCGGANEGQTWIESFTPKAAVEPNEDYETRLLKSIMEVVKYISHFDYGKESPARLRELKDGLHNRRQFSSWGVLHKLRQLVDSDFEKVLLDKLDDFICQICGSRVGHRVKMLFDEFDESPRRTDFARTPSKPVEAETLERLKEMNIPGYLAAKRAAAEAERKAREPKQLEIETLND